MVMSTDPQEVNENIEFLDPVDGGGDTAVAEAPIENATDTTETEALDTEAPVDEVVAPDVEQTSVLSDIDSTTQEKPAAPQIDQKSIDELQQRRAADQEREWRESMGRKARAYEQQLQENGYMPEQARAQARLYVKQEQKLQQQERESHEMIGFIQGKQAAAVHFMKQHKLANQQMLDDLMALQNANTPAEMEREAKRIRRERALIAENTQLKQGRVAPQTFDNSQGSAEVSTNKESLMERYIRTGEGGEQIGKMFGLG